MAENKVHQTSLIRPNMGILVPSDREPSQIYAQIDNMARELQRLADISDQFERILEPIMRAEAPMTSGEKPPPQCTLAPLADTLRGYANYAEATWMRFESMQQRIEL